MVKYTEHEPQDEPEDWEYSHLPLNDPRAVLPPHMTCDKCGEPFLASDGVSITKFNGIDDVTYHFCGEHCATEFYLHHLRSGGGL